MEPTPTQNPYASPNPDATAPPATEPQLLEVTIDESTAIVATGQISEQDFFLAQRLHRQGSLAVGYVLVALLIVFAGGGLQFFFGASNRLGLYVLVGVTAYLGWALFVLPRQAARASWNRSYSLREPMKRRITPEVVQTLTPSSSVMLRWSHYASYRASDQLVIIYLKEHAKLFLAFPRHTFFHDADWKRFLELLATKLPKA